MPNQKLTLELELKKKKVAITKAKAVKEELDLKILEREFDIERMKDHKKLQDEVIKKMENEIKEIEKRITDLNSTF